MPNQVGRDGKLWMLEIMVQEKNRHAFGLYSCRKMEVADNHYVI